MIRLLHFFAIVALISSAAYAYSIKYDTLLNAEKLARLKTQILREQDTIAVYKAEWQRLNRPDRLQELAEKHLRLQQLTPTKIVRIDDIPFRAARNDEIGRKLELLGVLAPTGTPHAKSTDRAQTTTSSRTSTAANQLPRSVSQAKSTSSATPQYTGSIRPAPPRSVPSRQAPPPTQKPRASVPTQEPLRLLPPLPIEKLLR
jgi:hypothetical protein